MAVEESAPGLARTELQGRKLKSGVVVPHEPKWHRKLAAGLVFGGIQSVAATIRFVWHDHSGLLDRPGRPPIIFATWHNRLALSLVVHQRYVLRCQPGRRLAAIVSASRDGGLLARILEHFDVEPVRGSTSRRGPQALLELTTWAERGLDLAITPDGPRGPRYVVQNGVMALAQLTGQPIVPVSYDLRWKVCLKSWDQFQVPVPFSRCEVHFGEPVLVPRETSDAEREELRLRLQERLRGMTRD
jgi:hypothetical protein